jgi:hypothetical protein
MRLVDLAVGYARHQRHVGMAGTDPVARRLTDNRLRIR